VDGDFTKLRGTGTDVCIEIYDPVTVTATGVWGDRGITWERTYPNKCYLRNETYPIFEF
jgi:hypothetical protein